MSLLIVACTVNQTSVDLRKANWSIKQKDFNSAVQFYKRIIKRNPKSEESLEAAKMGYRVALFNLEDFKEAVGFLSHVVTNSPNLEDRKEAQRNLATLYFEKINDYRASVIEFNRYLNLGIESEEAIDFRFDLARSHFYLKEFYQSEVEINTLLKSNLSEKKKFQALLFLANVYLANKQTEKAITQIKALKKEYPVLSDRENINITLSVAYEELNDFTSAIEILQNMRNGYSKPEFIDLKIRRLQERQKNLPGARGLRK